MNELSLVTDLKSEKTVTTKELAEVLGVDVSAVIKTVKRLNETSDVLPKFKQGQTPRYTEEQATLIKQEIQKHHNLASRQIDVELITVNEKGDIQTVSARELYEKLDLSERFSKWWDRFCSYGFEEGIDYFGGVYQKVQGNQYGGEQSLTDYAITIEMAKQICMLQRSEKGKQYREYFLQIEKAWNSPEMVMKRALQIAQKQVEEMKIRLLEQKPKVDFYDCVTGSKDTVDMKECAKVINFRGWGRNKIFELLRQKGVLDRGNQPYQRYCDMKYFRIIESKYILPTGEVKISLKTVVYQRGLDFIRKLIEKEENEHKKPLKLLTE